jgi:hypothetical protein
MRYSFEKFALIHRKEGEDTEVKLALIFVERSGNKRSDLLRG